VRDVKSHILADRILANRILANRHLVLGEPGWLHGTEVPFLIRREGK
jgi:hypothetical protein